MRVEAGAAVDDALVRKRQEKDDRQRGDKGLGRFGGPPGEEDGSHGGVPVQVHFGHSAPAHL